MIAKRYVIIIKERWERKPGLRMSYLGADGKPCRITGSSLKTWVQEKVEGTGDYNWLIILPRVSCTSFPFSPAFPSWTNFIFSFLLNWNVIPYKVKFTLRGAVQGMFSKFLEVVQPLPMISDLCFSDKSRAHFPSLYLLSNFTQKTERKQRGQNCESMIWGGPFLNCWLCVDTSSGALIINTVVRVRGGFRAQFRRHSAVSHCLSWPQMVMIWPCKHLS